MKKIVLFLCMLPVLAFAQAVLPTSWNFTTPGISTPPVGWITGLGTNGNLTYSAAGYSVGGDALSCKLDAKDEFLTVWFADKPGDLSYYVRGTGSGANPPFAGSFKVQESVDGNSWNDIRTFTAMTTTLTRYSETLSASSRYVRFFYADKQDGSNVALDSVLIINSPAPAKGILVKQNTTTLVNGNVFDFGNPASKLFTIENFGTSADLKIDSMIVSGVNASDFSIGAFDSITPFNNGTDTFSIYFNAGANGSRFGTLKIYSNDAERNPFEVNLYAIGGQFASEPTGQVGAVNISNIKSYALNVSFSRATGAEKYILLRKTGATITDVPLDGVTYQRGDYIGNAQVAYIGDDTAMLTPNYILANTSYSFAAFAFNGPAGYENYNTTAAPTATATTLGSTPGSYYNNIDTNNLNFVTALGSRVRLPHDTVFYSNYASTIVNNYLARDTSGGKKVLDCVYTGLRHVYEDPFVWWNGSNTGTLTREHTFAQSWMPTNTGGTWPEVGGKEVLEYNDLHNLFPAHQINANAKRSNYPFGVIVGTPTYTSPTGQGKLGVNANSATIYEPRDEQKGDLARALFYMLVHYNGVKGIQWRLPVGQDINVLLQWHQQDPPSAIEIARNEYIYSVQKNRNPFIDNPTWVNKINFATMAYIPNPNAVFVDLTSPNGGQTLMVGTNQNINWTAQNIDTVAIYYRTATANAWMLITDTVPANRGTYGWTIPNTPTTTAMVFIKDKNDVNIADSSATTFVIDVPRSLAITYPAGGETLVRGNSYTVTWNQQNIDTVTIQIRTTTGPWTTLGKVAAANGVYMFTLTSATTTTAVIRVVQTSNPATNSMSANFTIVQSALNITTMADTTWSANQTKTIYFTKTLVDTVAVSYIGLNTQTTMVDTVVLENALTTDSINFTLPNLYSNLTLWVREVNAPKAPNYLAKDNLSFAVKLSSGLNTNNTLNNLVNVYPVPSSGLINITTPSNLMLSQIQVFDITGKLVETTTSNHINLTQKGIYIIKVITNEGVATKRVIIE
ncbi:MAG: endonuclease [Bacteroidia bacterium]|nr:endonuclease [Bacteroidia bacterium]